MRSKVKVISREEILKNFTRDFLIEEKKRCEIDRYVTDFRILIHRRPHENHNYLNRLLQDYTSMFLSHERISVNKSNEGEMKRRLMRQLTSKMKDSPKKRYVKSKLFSKHPENSEHQSYLIMKAKTTEFLLQLQKYEELEQIAHELFAKHSNNEYANEIRDDSNRNCSYIPENYILKLKTVEIPLEIPYKKTVKHVYVVNNAETRHAEQGSQDREIISISSNSSHSPTKNLLENYEYVKDKTSKFLENNKNYNDAEQKVLSEQYQLNSYIKKYVDNLNSFDKDSKKFNSPKQSFFNKIKNMIRFHSENTNEIHRNKKDKPLTFAEETEVFLMNERTYNNFEFEAYKLFHTNNGRFENPLTEYNKNDIHAKTLHFNRDMNKSNYDNEKFKNDDHYSSPLKKPISEEFNQVKSPNSQNHNQFVGVMQDIEFQFNPTMKHLDENKFDLIEGSPIVSEVKIDNIHKTLPENLSNYQTQKADQENRFLIDQTKEFLLIQKKYEDEQLKFYIMFINEHPSSKSKSKNKKDSLLYKIKQLFKLAKTEKTVENLYYFRQLTDEFLRNERYCYDQGQISVVLKKIYPTDSQVDANVQKETVEIIQKTPDSKTMKLPPSNEKHRTNNKFDISPSVLHQRSRSEDLLTLKSKTKSLDNTRKPPSPGHKSLSDRIKKMVGIGNRKRTKSRENILNLTDPVQYFLNHERFYYDGEPISKIYNRSVSLLNQPVKTRAPMRKTDNSLSTENVLHKDQNNRMSAKPPTGRRRQERRNEEGKSKRRSRTLSPAQKLVSKFKSIIQREDKNKEGKKKSELLRKETEEFLEDQKNFVDVFENYSLNSQFENIESNVKKESSIHEKIEIDENHPSRSSLYYPEQGSTKWQSETSSVSIDIKSDDLKSDSPMNTYQQTKYDKINLPEINHTPMKTASSSKNEEFVFDDTEFLKNQTRKFLHNMKKYNDFDKNSNDVNKTLIFINNKTSTLGVISGANESGEAVADTQYSKAIFDEKQEECMVNKNLQNQFSEQNFTVHPTSHTPKKSPKNCKEFSKQKSLSETIFCETFDEEKIITRRVFSEKIQTKPISLSNSEKVDSQNEQNIASPHVNDTETKDNKLIQKSTEPNKLSFSSEIPEKHKSKSKIEKLLSPAISEKPERITILRHQEYPLLMNQTTEFLNRNQYFIHEDEMNFPKSDIPPDVSLGERSVESDVSILKNEAHQKLTNSKSNTTRNTISKIKSFITSSTKPFRIGENHKMIKQQTIDFLEHMKRYNTEEYENCSRYKIIWLSENEKSSLKVDEVLRKNISKNKIEEYCSDKNDSEEEAYMYIKNQTGIFLKDQKVYNIRQRNEDNRFHQKLKEPENKFWLPTKHETENKRVRRFENLISSTSTKKPQHFNEEKTHLQLRDQTPEFLDTNQYSSNKEEINLKNSNNSENHAEDQEPHLSKAISNQLEKPKDDADLTSSNRTKKQKKSTFSKIKSLITGNRPQLPDKEEFSSIMKQTTEFLEDMENYTHNEYEASSKYKINWLSEIGILPQTIDRTTEQNISKKIEKGYGHGDRTYDRKSFAIIDTLIKEHNNTFLKEHKDYHDRQINEENNFYKKMGMPKQNFWLSSNNENRNFVVRKIDKLISPFYSKELHQHRDVNNYSKTKDQTAEFLDKNRYFIHEREMKFGHTHNFEDVEKKSHVMNVTAKQVTQPKPKIDQNFSRNTEKQKKSTISKIGTSMTGSHQQVPDEKHPILMKNQRTEFLEDFTTNKNEEFKITSESKIVWLKNAILPQKTDRSPEKRLLTKTNNESLKLIKERNSTFLKDHKDYHDRQRNEDNKFYQNINTPLQKLWLSSKNDNNPSKWTESPLSMAKDTLSDINSPNLKDKDTNDIKQKMSEFQENVRICNDRTFDPYSKHKIPRLNEEDADQQMSETSVKSDTFEKNIGIKMNIHDILETAADLRLKRDSKSDEKNISPSQSPNPKRLRSKMNQWLSQPNSKESLPIYNDKKYQYLRSQTNNFLNEQQYLIHREEVDSKKKVTYADSTEKTPKQTRDLSKMKSGINETTERGRKSHDKMISAQTAEFLENLKRHNDIQFDTSAKIKISPLKADNTLSLDQNHSKSMAELEGSSTHSQKSDVTSKSETANDNKCEPISQKLIAKIQERKLEKLSPESMIETNTSEYKLHLIDAQKTDTFLKDHKSFHDNQRIEDNNFLSKMGKPERKLWLSSTNLIKNRITDEIEKLCSPTLSKEPEHSNKEKSYLHVKNSTAEFLERNRYLIHKEELNLNNLHNVSDKTCEQETQIMTIKKKERTFDGKEEDQTSRNSFRKNDNTFSKIKSFIIGKQKQTQMKEDHKVIMQHTIEFLEDLKMYTKEESDMNSKRTVIWLSEQRGVSTTVFKINRENDSEILIHRKCKEGSEKKVPLKIVKECKIKGNNDDGGTYEYIKKHTLSFLKEQKDYHNHQRIEDNKFYQKSSRFEEENCSFSGITNENTINHKIQKQISPAVSRPPKHSSDAKACLLLRNKTAEFLKKNQYFIHEEEMNFKSSSTDGSVDKETAMSIVTVNQQLLNKNTVTSNKQKRGTLSKLKSLITGKRNQPLKNKDFGLFRKQTAEFLEHLKEYNRKEYEVMSREKIVWLCDQEIIPQKIVSAEVIEENRKEDNDIDYQRYDILIKKPNETFLKDHKDYHNKQRSEEHKFIQQFCETEEKLGLSTNITQKHIIGRKIENILSPNVPKKSRHSIDVGTYLLLRDQTEKFLKENQYSIYKEEVHPESVTYSVHSESKDVVNRQKESFSLSTVPRPECRKEIENTTESCERKSVDKPSIGNNRKIIDKQGKISEKSKKCNNSQNKTYFLSGNGISSTNRNESLQSLQKTRATIIERNEGENENRDDKIKVIREMNDTFLRDHKDYNNKQWNDYKLPHNMKISDQKLSISLKTGTNDNRKSGSTEGSTSNTIASEKKTISKLNSDQLHPIRRITTNNIIFDNQSKNSYEHNNENVDVNGKSVLLFSNDQEQSPNIKKKVTFCDHQETSEDESSFLIGTNQSKMIKQKTQLFLEKNRDYHNVQWGEYKKFHQKIPKAEKNNSFEKISESLPVAWETKYVDSFCSPEKAADVNNEKACKEMMNLSMKNLKKQQYSICDEEIDENKLKPKPTPRKLKTDKKLLMEQNSSHEVPLSIGRDSLLFLQDHQSYHDKERQELINFETDRKKHLENITKTSCRKEKKSKSKLISKLKSFVEGSAEIFSSDNKKTYNELKKQTAEFLISQKCFWDLQRTAEHIVEEKKDSTKYDKNTEIIPDYSKNLSKNYFHPLMEKKKQVTPDKLTIRTSDNSTPQPPNQKKIIEEYEFSSRKNELFLKDHQRYHDSELRDFIAFSVHRKKNRNESPNEDENIQNTIPQNSSNNQKSLEMDISMKNENEPLVQNKQNIDAKLINDICAIFLNNQRCYIDSANEGWRRYVMYEPKVAVLRKKISKSQPPNSKQHSSTKTFHKLNNQQYSETDVDDIDYVVKLHKTKLFLENHKNYHDNLQNQFDNYISKNIYRNDISEPQPRDKKDGVLDKIKSIFPSGHNKMSYNVQKHKFTTHNPKEVTDTGNELHGEDCPITMLKAQTDLFLKDHQHYHNRQHADFIEHFANNSNEVQLLEKKGVQNKITKKSMMSKLKSLLGSDSSKNSKNEKRDDFFKATTKLFLEDQIQYSLIEKSAEQIFNEFKPKLEVRKIESTPICSPRSASTLKNNKEGPSIENNDHHVEQKSSYHQEDEEDLINKTSLGINKKKSDMPITGMIGNGVHERSVTHDNAIHISNSTLFDNEISDEAPLLTNAVSNISKTERENYAREKIQTQKLLLDQKQFASTGIGHNLIYSADPTRPENKQPEDKNIEVIASNCTLYSRNDAENISSCNSEDTNSRVVTNVRESSIQARNENEHYTMKGKTNFDSSLVERVERPMSPTKTIFKELRTRDNSPDNRVYILSEGYTITREANEGKTSISTKNLQKQQHESSHNKCLSQENKNSFNHSASHQVENMQAEEMGPSSSTGQDSTSDSIEYSPSKRISQEESAVKQLSKSKRRTYREMEEEPRSFITEARIESNGEVMQRYTTSCYFHQVPTAIWYTESLILDLEEKTQKIHEKAYYVNQLRPDYWSETFETDVTTKGKMYISKRLIPISHDSDDIHYISLENQQKYTQNEMVCNDE